jgi:MHS family proline/betaine transporter-like MFS transporter
LSEVTTLESFTPHERRFYMASACAVAWLIKATGNTMAPAWYMIGCVIISLIAVSMLEETGGRELATKRSYGVSSTIS